MRNSIQDVVRKVHCTAEALRANAFAPTAERSKCERCDFRNRVRGHPAHEAAHDGLWALREENRLEYGKGISRFGKKLFVVIVISGRISSSRSSKTPRMRSRRRGCWTGSRAVHFDLTRQALRIRHLGAPFDAGDVRGICGIDESTKDHSSTAIGRFGIGFKVSLRLYLEARGAFRRLGLRDRGVCSPVRCSEDCPDSDETELGFPSRGMTRPRSTRSRRDSWDAGSSNAAVPSAGRRDRLAGRGWIRADATSAKAPQMTASCGGSIYSARGQRRGEGSAFSFFRDVSRTKVATSASRRWPSR